jgi:putative ABC transport system permease protein
MKFLPLILAGMLRKRGRALLMLLQMVSAFTLFGVLQGFNSGLKELIASTHADRLYVASAVTIGDPLPLSHLERIKSVPGVQAVAVRQQFGGTYQKPTEFLPVIGTYPAEFFSIYDEMNVTKAHVQALARTRTGAIIGTEAMSRHGIKLGDRIGITSPLQRQDGRAWEFDIVGSYDVPDRPEQSIAIVANFDYINEGRRGNRDTVLMYIAKIADPNQGTEIGLRIDNQFANSGNETHTQNESELAQGQIQRIGDIDFIVRGVVAAVFFALLLAIGALMMQSIRERVPELAVLKTVGFTDERVMAIILIESVVFCVIGAAIGLALARLLLPLARGTIGVPNMPNIVLLMGFGFAVALALIGGAVPAWRGLKLKVADALADA